MNNYFIKYMFCKLPFIVIPQLSYSTVKRNHNLKNLLLTMPKERIITQNLQKARSKLKEKSQKYVPGTVTLKVLGSGAKGAPRSLYVFTDQSRYLFNCGEGTQRLAHEHKMRLSKLEQIFVTYPSWDNIGGLPGIALTIQDVGVPEITLHGPAELDDIFPATKRFVVLKDLSVKMADCSNNNKFQDAVMQVNYVPIHGELPETNEALGERLENLLSESEDDVDYYEHERKRKKSEDDGPSNVKRSRTIPPKLNVSMSYICKLQDRPGSLCLERCVEKKVPSGPLLGQLKAGHDVTLKDGTVVKAEDVRLPNELGPVFLVVECPTLEYVESLINEQAFVKHQATADKQDNLAQVVVHFTPHNVMEDPRYRQWMDRFSPSTQHLLLNDTNKCLGSVAVHRIQQKLHLLHPDIFPLLNDHAIPRDSGPPPGSTLWFCETPSNSSIETVNSVDSSHSSSKTNSITCQLVDKIRSQIKTSVNQHRELDQSNNLHPFSGHSQIVNGHTFCNFHLRPLKGLDRADELKLYPLYYAEETLAVPEFLETLQSLSLKLETLAKIPSQDYPRVVFLGTGSCIPNKTRNTSGILLHISDSACILLDCGEGTYGQLVRFYGSKVDQVLRNLRAIYISHLHADHHIGLIGLLKGRRLAFTKSSTGDNHQSEPVFLIAPKQIKYWLNFYDRRFEPLVKDLRLIPNGTLYLGDHKIEEDVQNQLYDRLNMCDISTVLVHHCPNAFGVALTHRDWKISYSGDTMPCEEFVTLGQGSDLLIHEATMEDELEDEARLKLHSTTSQAINIGKKMNAKFTLLTHFSQRYAKLPRLDDNMLSANVGIAFDNMQVSLDQLPILPLLYPSLKLMFANHHEELEQKAIRRNLKREREKMEATVP